MTFIYPPSIYVGMTDIKTHTIPLGPVLVIMIGPVGAGKRDIALRQFDQHEFIIPSVVAHNLIGGQIRYDKDQLVMDEINHMVESKLRAGGRAVVCDTNLKAKRRLELKAIGDKYHAKIIYLVVDRDITEKRACCPSSHNPKGLDMVQITHDIFQRYESAILSGDSNKTVTVIDSRKSHLNVIHPLPRVDPLIDLKSRGFSKIRVIPDVHGNLAGLISILGTVSPDMFLVFLGDIVDYGPDSWKCVEFIHELVTTGRAIMLRGNHDRKMVRFIEQRMSSESFSGNISHGMRVTVDQWDRFSYTTRTAMGHRFLSLVDLSPDWLQLGNWMFAHAAVSSAMINNPQFRATKDSSNETTALYGETNGEVDEVGKPVRTYEWTFRIPDPYSAMVGHQIRSLSDPVIQCIPNGGKVVFLDTGSSKYIDDISGRLSYCDFDIVDADWGNGIGVEMKEFGHE